MANAFRRGGKGQPMTSLASIAPQDIWLGWRQEITELDGPTKVPYAPRTGRLGSATDAGTWATLAEAKAWVARARGSGPGLVLGAELQRRDHLRNRPRQLP